jgi:hypothetical protein
METKEVNKGGRKSLYQELQIANFLSELTPKAVKFINQCYAGEDKADKRWASDQIFKLVAKTIPAPIQISDPDGNPLTILIGEQISKRYDFNDPSSKQDSPEQGKV